ncbi:MAG: mitochondrial fission ELM1 family protein, partial [Alphaproteobacteria bacterium]|nr:mitochondrial fission ELM1 family protein [Alphaproteobacteria bacterium]
MVALNLGNRIAAVPNESEPLVWVLHDGKPGMRSQALGLAEATGFRFVEKVLTVKRPWAWLPPQLWLQPLRAVNDRGVPLAPPWPDLVIGCGRHSAMPALAVRRASGCGTFAAQIQDPRVGRDEFDLLLVPEHDRLRGPRVAVTQGAIHRVTPTRLAEARRHFPALAELPRPVLAVLVGGANRSYRLGLDRLGTLAEAIASILRAGGGSA